MKIQLERRYRNTWIGSIENIDFVIFKGAKGYNICYYDANIDSAQKAFLDKVTVKEWKDVKPEIRKFCSVVT